MDTLTLGSITELDVSRYHGSNTGNVLLGAGLGAAAGAALGLGVTVVGCAIDDAGGMCALAALPSMFVLGTVGLFVGVYMGSRVESDDWDRIYPSRRASITVAPIGNQRIGIGLAVAFGGSA